MKKLYIRKLYFYDYRNDLTHIRSLLVSFFGKKKRFATKIFVTNPL